jgi:DeoR family transcriptional regulator, carbon catabolite repression regulator
MHQSKRIARIKELLAEKKELTTKEIMNEFNISQDTARRDILLLVERGAAIRTHGGIISPNYDNLIPGYEERMLQFTKEKNAIAEVALSYLRKDVVCFVDVSTTLLKFCQKINEKVTVFTHSLDNVLAMSLKPYININLLGGKLNIENRFFYGMDTLQKISKIRFDIAFIATGSIDKEGIYLVNQEDAAIIQCVIENSRKVILVAENQKFQYKVPYHVCSLDKIDVFITDKPLTKEQRNFFNEDTEIKVINKE